MMEFPITSSSGRSAFKMPSLFEQSSEKVRGAAARGGRRSRSPMRSKQTCGGRRSRSPMRSKQTCRSRSPCRDIVQTMLGKVIVLDTQTERPFCWSSVTMPDLGDEVPFPNIDLKDESNDEECMGSPQPPPLLRAVSSDSRPSMPTRRTSENFSAAASDSSTGPQSPPRGRVCQDHCCGADKTPSMPGRRCSSRNIADRAPSVPGRQCSFSSVLSSLED